MIIFLLPPSEGKTSGGDILQESLSFPFDKPLAIATHATEKDLKCTGKRYEEGMMLNKSVGSGPYMPAIERYSGVMFSAIGYADMASDTQSYFVDHVRILSGMYGILEPLDTIADYKLPIGTKGLYGYWGKRVTETFMDASVVVDLLPGAHKKMIDFAALEDAGISVVHVDFFVGEKKLTHGVKKVKGTWLRDICAAKCTSLEQLKSIPAVDDVRVVFS